MVILESQGHVRFVVDDPRAHKITLVGRFDGYHDQHIPMTQISACRWEAHLHLGAGEYLFGYLVNDETWLIDPDAHGTLVDQDGRAMSRLWCPPNSIEPDSIAA
jgi:1,4-alpha-glucan branching enzyme